jgi:hypothetical protein
MAVQPPVNPHRAAEQTRTGGFAGEVPHRFNGAQQHGRTIALTLGYHIHAMVHAVNKIDVGVAGRAEHDFGARRNALGGMRGQVMFAQIRLHLDDFADALEAAGLVDEQLAEQFARDGLRVAVVKAAGQFLHGGSLA